MVSTNQIAVIGILVGDPARAAILTTLMDGGALTASELARVAGVTPQTASSHLSILVGPELIEVRKQGRHRYHRLSRPEVARMLEVHHADRFERRSYAPTRKVVTATQRRNAQGQDLLRSLCRQA